MNGLAPILHLRALREARAAAAARAARAQLDAALAGIDAAEAAVLAHDHAAAEQDARLHDAMIRRGFDMADLTEADIRARHAAARRKTLAAAHLEATRAAQDARDHAEVKARDLRRAVVAHEKMRLAADLCRPTEEPADD